MWTVKGEKSNGESWRHEVEAETTEEAFNAAVDAAKKLNIGLHSITTVEPHGALPFKKP